MAISLNQWAWSTTPADNATADDQINWAEGQDPATVNNSARGMMAAIAKMTDVQSGNVTVGGTGNAITLTTGQTISTGHQALGFRVCFKAAASNTGAVTVAVDGLSAVAIKRPNGDALSADDILSGGFYDLAFDGTNYKLLNMSSLAGSSTLELVSTDAGANSGPTLSIYRNSPTPAASDTLGIIRWYGEDSAGNKQEYATDYVAVSDVTSGTEDATRYFSVATAGADATELALSGTALYPATDNGLSLGQAANVWTDAYFGAGAVLDFDGNATITHFTGGWTFSGAAIFSHDGGDVASSTTMRVQRTDADSAIGYELIDFYAATGQVGSITLTTVDGVSGSVAYNTSSDSRRKPVEHRRPIDDSGDIIDALNPIRYRWDDSDEDCTGFIAQEVVEVLPQAVRRGDDDPNKRPGDEGYQGWEMAVGSMEALLVAEIKALRARVAALEAK